MRKDEKFNRDDKKADASMHHCVNYQSAHEESAEEIVKDNEQTWKWVHEEERTRRQLNKENEHEVNDIIWKSSYVQR